MLAVAVASSRTLEVLDLEGTGLTNQSAQVWKPTVPLQHHRHLKGPGLGSLQRPRTCLQPHAGEHMHPLPSLHSEGFLLSCGCLLGRNEVGFLTENQN